MVHLRFMTYDFRKQKAKAVKFSLQICFCSGVSNFGIQRAETLFIPKSSDSLL